MEAPKTIRRPANWQDFESLCKKLWGEIWGCPEIQKNGRLGQEQFGVDVFGRPFGEDVLSVQVLTTLLEGNSTLNESPGQTLVYEDLEYDSQSNKYYIPDDYTNLLNARQDILYSWNFNVAVENLNAAESKGQNYTQGVTTVGN